MEDFFRAGGLHAVLRQVRDLLDPTALTVTGQPLVDYLDDAEIWDREVIRTRARAAAGARRNRRAVRQPGPDRRGHQAGGRVPGTCCSTAAGRWSSTRSRTCTPGSTIPTSTSTPTRCWSCAAAVRRAIPACPRWPTCRCRPSCSQQGVRDMVRICDGRMSGTAYGTVVLHVVAGGGGRRPAGAGPDRRHASCSTSPAAGSTSTSAPDELAARTPIRPPSRPSPARPRLGAAVRATPSSRPTPAPTSTSWSDRAATRCRASRTKDAHVWPNNYPRSGSMSASTNDWPSTSHDIPAGRGTESSSSAEVMTARRNESVDHPREEGQRSTKAMDHLDAGHTWT